MIVVLDSAIHSQKDGVESIQGSLMDLHDLQVKPPVKTCDCWAANVTCDKCCCSTRLIAPTKKPLEREKRHNAACL